MRTSKISHQVRHQNLSHNLQKVVLVDQHKDLGLTLKSARSRKHPVGKIADADYTDCQTPFSDKIANAEKLLRIDWKQLLQE